MHLFRVQLLTTQLCLGLVRTLRRAANLLAALMRQRPPGSGMLSRSSQISLEIKGICLWHTPCLVLTLSVLNANAKSTTRANHKSHDARPRCRSRRGQILVTVAPWCRSLMGSIALSSHTRLLLGLERQPILCSREGTQRVKEYP